MPKADDSKRRRTNQGERSEGEYFEDARGAQTRTPAVRVRRRTAQASTVEVPWAESSASEESGSEGDADPVLSKIMAHTKKEFLKADKK